MEKSLRNLLAAPLVCLLAFAAVFGAAPAAEDPFADGPEFAFSFASAAPEGTTAVNAAELFKKLINERTKGKIAIDVYPNAQLGGDREAIEGCQTGDIGLVITQPAPMVSFVPELAVFDLPNLFTSDQEKTQSVFTGRFLDKLRPAYEARGFRLMGLAQGGTFRETSSNVPIRTIDDFKSLKIRTMENKFHVAYWKALGANPTPIPGAEVYLALQQGVVVAEENAYETIIQMKFFEQQKYIINTHHLICMNTIIMNNAAYNRLPEAYRKVVDETMAEVIESTCMEMVAFGESKLQELKDAGLEVMDLPQSELDKMQAAAHIVYTMVRESIGDELVDILIADLK